MKSGNWFGNLFMYFLTVWLMNLVMPLGHFLAIFGAWQVGHDLVLSLVSMAAFRDIDYTSFYREYHTVV